MKKIRALFVKKIKKTLMNTEIKGGLPVVHDEVSMLILYPNYPFLPGSIIPTHLIYQVVMDQYSLVDW